MIIGAKKYKELTKNEKIKDIQINLLGDKVRWQLAEIQELEKQYDGLIQDNARLIKERNTAIEGYKELEQEYNKLKKSNEVIRQAIIESNKQEFEWLNGKHWDDVDG